MTSPEPLPGAPGRDAVTGAPGAISGPESSGPESSGTESSEHGDQRDVIRPARPEDLPEILAMVRELAEYERSAHEVLATEEQLASLLFGTNTPSGVPAAYCHIALSPTDDGAPAGMALWFLNASTWTGRHGIYLEDLYVRPAFRGLGLGQALMAELARICVDREYARLEWWVLDWNVSAQGFYADLGARRMAEWEPWRLDGDALVRLGAGQS